MFLTIPNDIVKGPDTVGDEVVRLKKIEVLCHISTTEEKAKDDANAHRGRRRHLHSHPGLSSL